ncbi:MAG: SDR family oxidoreductase [Pirellulales bacterium]|nr:SDR family oxidoreductase [Pirellulales bacterium]
MPTTLVSGGSRGLGLATVERLLARGDQVATFSRSGSAALTALAEQHAASLHTACLDAREPEEIRQFVATARERFGGITHCIANAAIAHEGVLATMRDDQIDSMLAVNLTGSIVLVREAVRQMLFADAAESPSIVVVSSVVARTGSQGLSVYAATKAGLEGFAVSLARELGPRGIRVNAVAPGFLETDLSQTLSDDNRSRIVRRTAMGRLGTPADVVAAIDYLTSPRAAFITGQTLAIDGGA